MRGFLRRDAYLLLPLLRFYGPLVLLTLGLTFYSEKVVSFFLLYLLLLGQVGVQHLFSYDESNGWRPYAAALPGGRRAMVDARYLVTLGIGALLGLTELLVNCRLGRGGLLYSGLFLLLLSAFLPVAYRFGVRWAALLTVLTVGMVVIGVVGLLAWQDLMLDRDVSGTLALLGFALPLGGLLALFLSWPLSRAIMRKKEC